MDDSARILAERIYFKLEKSVPIKTGQLVNKMSMKEMKTKYVIKISAIRYDEKAFKKSLSKGVQATYFHKAPKGRENEPRGVVKHFRSKTTKYYQYDYAYVTEVRNKSSKGWVMNSIYSSIKEL